MLMNSQPAPATLPPVRMTTRQPLRISRSGSCFTGLFAFVLLSLLFFCSSVGAYTSGQFLTGSNSSNNYSSVTVGPGNAFYGAWRIATPSAIKFGTFNGSSWTEIPTASFTGAQVATALADSELDGIMDWGPESIAVNASGDIHVVFAVGTAAGGIPNRRGLAYGKYTASTTSWAFRKLFILSHGSGFYNVGNGSGTVKLDTSGNPHVVFTWSDANVHLDYLEYAFFNGSVWNVSGNTNAFDSQRIDSSTISAQEMSSPDIAFDSLGNLHCSFTKDSAATLPDIMYIKRTGTIWGAAVTAANVDNASGTSLVLDSSNNVYIADRTTSGATVTYRLTTNASGSFVTSNVATYTFPSAATISAGDVVMKINGAGRKIIGGPLKGNTSIGTAFRFVYETSPGTWAQEEAFTDGGTLNLAFPSMTLRSDNTVMALFSRQVSSPDRNVYFTTGIPTGLTGGGGGPTAPTVTTATQSSVTHNSATLGGNVTADGGAAVSDRGIVWGLALNPTTADTKVANGTGTGAFSATVNGLPAGTTIHVRAYAINSVNTSYGSDISFTTLPAVAVTSLNRANTTPTNAATVNWTLTFASAVTGATASNFSLTGAAATGSSIGTPTTGNAGLTWNIPVTTGSTDGTLTLNLANATGLSSAISTALPFAGQSYTIDKTPPTVLSVTRLTPSGQTTSATSVIFRVTYSEPVTLTAPESNRFAVVPVGGSTFVGSVTGVTGTGATRDVTVTQSSGLGEFRLRVID